MPPMWEFNAMGSGFKIEFNESVSRTEGNTTENEEEAAVNVASYWPIAETTIFP